MKKYLNHILASDPKLSTIRAFIAREALNADDPTAFFKDLADHGCISGMVSGLIYYTDTHQFYDYYYYEIEKIRESYEEDFGTPSQINGDLKNSFAWFAFEHVAYVIVSEFKAD